MPSVVDKPTHGRHQSNRCLPLQASEEGAGADTNALEGNSSQEDISDADVRETARSSRKNRGDPVAKGERKRHVLKTLRSIKKRVSSSESTRIIHVLMLSLTCVISSSKYNQG